MTSFVPPRRQIHLDFHTSASSRNVGELFDPDEFAATMVDAAVDSVLLFARCHHGWMYYNSKRFPERRHPEMEGELLAAQIDALRKVGIRAPVYTTVQWDNFTCDEHPEWRIVHPDGALEGTPPYEAGFYRKLCLNSPFRDFMKEQARDLLERFELDGLYFDFIRPDDCSCVWCRRSMDERGLDASDERVRRAFGLEVINSFEKEMFDLVRSIAPDCGVTFNGGHIGIRHRELATAYSHFELETLPSGGWGYMYFPITQRYARRLGPTMGTTGKFHTTWGDYRSYKNPAALEYEVFRMLSLGAATCVGDQLDPSGRLDPDVYSLVGKVFRSVRDKEPWCVDATPVSEIAVLHPEEFLGGGVRDLPLGIEGATRILEEGGHQFDIVDSHSSLEGYSLLILPDRIPVEGDFLSTVERFLAQGGRVLATFASGMDTAQTRFTLGELAVHITGDGPRDSSGTLTRGRTFGRNDFAEYLRPREGFAEGLAGRELAMFIGGMQVEARNGGRILADTVSSVFDRSWRHFSSHLQGPPSGEASGAAVVTTLQTVYFSHPLFQQYEQNAPLWAKQLVLKGIASLLPEPLIRHDGPSTMRVTINEQAAARRWVVHLLHYIPERRGRDFDVVEDVIELVDVSLDIRVPAVVTRVSLEPSGDPLEFTQSAGRIALRVARVTGHQMVVLSMA